jgi:hypothetical protein
MGWNGRNFAIIKDTETGVTRVWYQSSGQNAVKGTWYPTYGIATLDDGSLWIAKGLDLPSRITEEIKAAEALGKTDLASALNEAVRSGGRQHEAAFEWANSGGVQGTPVPSTPAEINQAGLGAQAPILNQTVGLKDLPFVTNKN